MLSMLKPEMITKSQQVGIIQQKAFYDDEPQMTIEEEGNRPMGRSHGQGFGVRHEPNRPSTANVFPNVSRGKVRHSEKIIRDKP